MNMKDPVVEEVRRTRHAIEDRFGGNLRRMLAYYMQKQEEHPERLIRVPAKKQLCSHAQRKAAIA